MTTAIENQLKDFRSYLVQLGYRPGTVHMVYECARDFIVYTTITDIREVLPADIVGFYEYLHIRPHKLKEGGLSEQYISHHV